LRYRCRVDGQELVLDVDTSGRILLDHEALAADVVTVAPEVWSIILAGRSHEVALLERDPLRLNVDGQEVAVEVIDERQSIAFADSAAETRSFEVRAPMPGLIVTVHVREGDVVEAGASICTLEAMKMENELTVPRRGRVATLRAAPGVKVNGGALLAVLAPE